MSTPRSSRAKVGGPLRIRLFGPPSIERDGRAVSLDTRKAIAVVAYIALGGTQSRDHLAAALWPDATPDRARGALRRTLSVVRTAALGEALVSDGLSVGLRAGDVEIDTQRFRELAGEGRLAEAADVYTGDFLAGFSLRDAPDFDEWRDEQADGLRRELANILERLASDDRGGQRALRYARRWLALDRLHEPAHRTLMRLHARAGDRSAALRQYRECVRVLDRELGVSPMPETTALANAIERGGPEPEPATPSGPTSDETAGDLHTRHGDYGRAVASYERALADAKPEARRGLARKLAGVHHRRGDWDNAERQYAAALRGEDDVVQRARITADRSLVAHRRGDRARAIRLADDALALAKEAGDDGALAQAHNIVGLLRQDRTQLERSLALAERVGDDDARTAAMNNLALVLARSRETERAISLTEEALVLCARLGDRHREAALHNNLADLLRASGRKAEAMRHLKRAVTLFAEIGEPGTMEPEVWKLVEW